MAAPRKARPPATDILLQAAHAAYLAGRRSDAEKVLRQVLGLDPTNTAAWNNLASLMSESGRSAEAETAYRKAIALNPGFADFHANLGNLLVTLSRFAEAEESYREALRQRPENPPILAQLAQLLKGNGRLVEAEALFRQALAQDPGFALAHVNLGILLWDERRSKEAEAAYRNAIKIKPNFTEAYNNLGILLLDDKRFSEAEAAFRRAIELNPDFADAYSNLGNLLKQSARLSEAEAAYRRAIELKPDFAYAHINLGILLEGEGNLPQAEASYRRAAELSPADPLAHSHLGNLLGKLKRVGEAEASLRRAVEIKPDDAMAHNNLAALLGETRQMSEAEAALCRALDLDPDFAEARNNLGNLYQETKRLPEAEAAYRTALKLKPDFAEAYNNLGNVLLEFERFAEADAAFHRSVELKPDRADFHSNLGNLLKQTGRFPEAEAAYRRAIELKPDYTDARLNLGLLLLALGRLAEAWPYHEARYHPDIKDRYAIDPGLPCPQWQGESLVGKSLVVATEQGHGDNIQFVRYAPLLKARGLARLTLIQTAVLKPVIETADGIDQVVTSADGLPPHDYWCFPLSLPLYLGTTLDNIPATLPYIRVLPERAERWRKRLPPGNFKVGLVWKGNPEHKNDAHRSLPGLSTLAPLWGIPGITFVSLQKGQGEEEARRPPPGQPLLHLGDEIADFADTAAIIAQLDLLITIDSAAAHLAGALGIPVWVLLPGFCTDWRWLIERSDSPWYPDCMHLFRQKTDLGWQDVALRVAAALKSRVENPQPDTPRVRPATAAPSLPSTSPVTLPLRHEDALAQALAAYQSGRLAEAEATLRAMLARAPEDAGCWNNLGNLLQETGRMNEAEAAFRKAITLFPNHPDFHTNLGNFLKRNERLPEAEAAYRRAIELDPGNAGIHSSLGSLLHYAGRPADAEAAFRHALELKPDFADAYNNLGILLKDEDRLPEAEAAYRRAIELNPDFAEAHNNLGILMLESERLPEADTAFRRSVQLKPDRPDFHGNLGNLLKQTKQLEQAEAAYRHAIALKPGDGAAYNNLGVLLQEALRLAEAEAAYRRCLELNPGFASAHGNLATLLQQLDRLPEAEAAYRRAIELKPDNTDSRLNLGLLLLSLGRYAEAWPYHEARYVPDTKVRRAMHPRLHCPQWQGESLAGKTLVVVTEQGYGDNIQFVRYAPLLKARGLARLTLVQTPVLTPLVETMDGVDEVISRVEEFSPHDYWCFPLSLPLHLGTTLEHLPDALPYLRALPERVERWQNRLPGAGLKVGLVWKGNPEHKNDAHRSLPGLSTLAPLWDIPGITFVSLQKGQDEEEARRPPPGQPLLHLGDEIADFADTAAIIAQLDLVITIDSAAAHLAGALGIPVWVLLPGSGTDWRWLRDRSDSPWYPGVMRLFRQPRQAQSWDSTVQEVAAALRDRLAGTGWGAAAAPTATVRLIDKIPAYPTPGIQALPGPAEGTAPARGTADDLLPAAFAAYQAGRRDEAEAILRQILAQDPGHSAAWNNLANLLNEGGQAAAAEAAYRKAIALQPDVPDFHTNFGNFLKASNRPFEAVDAYREAVKRKPNDPPILAELALLLKATQRLSEAESLFRQAIAIEPGFTLAHNNLGILLYESERAANAEESFRAALALDPLFPEGWNNLGNALKAQKRFVEAEAHYRQALALRPGDSRFRNNLGVLFLDAERVTDAEESFRAAILLDPGFADAWNNLGIALQASERFADAEDAYRQALAIDPGLATTHGNLANTLRSQKRHAEAEAEYRAALALKPDDPDTLNNLAVLLDVTRHYEESHAAFLQAIANRPDFAAAWCNLGNFLKEQARFGEAEAAYRKAAEIKPDYTDAKLNLGLLLLSLGRYAEAWPWHEARHFPDSKGRRAMQPSFAFPQWHGESLAGKSLVVVIEQGAGDNIQFVRYASLLKAQGLTRLSFVEPAPFIPLLATAHGIDALNPDGAALPPHDYWCFPLSLPLYLGTTLETVPDTLPYLWALPERVERWRARIDAGGLKRDLRVGLVWKGNPDHNNDANRSLPHLTALAPLWDVTGIDFISLQKGQGEEEASNPPPGQPLLHLGSEIADFADTAAIIAQLDLLITIDSAAAHVAGALGKPVWVLIPSAGTDWRWLKDRTDTPWYPGTMRLIRQPRGATSWDDTLREVAAALGTWSIAPPAPTLPLLDHPLAEFPGDIISPPAPILSSLPPSSIGDEVRPVAGDVQDSSPIDVRPTIPQSLQAQDRQTETRLHFDLGGEPFRQQRSDRFGCPEWRGEDLAGKSLLIDSFEGDGDYIRCARYIPLLKQAGARRVMLCRDPALKPLLETVAGVDGMIHDLGSSRPHDFWCFSSSLPARFGGTPAAIPAQIPYVRALDSRVAYWHHRLVLATGFRVGLVWKADPADNAGQRHSLTGLTALAPLWTIPGVSFVSLQKGVGEEEARNPSPDQPILHLGSDIADFADTAAILSELDLLIAVDSAAAHVAGALGKPVWLLLSHSTDGRWQDTQGSNSPWYPGVMQIFRHASGSSPWDDEIHEVAAALAACVRGEQELVSPPPVVAPPLPAETTLRPPDTESSMEFSMKRPAPRPVAFVLTSSDHGTMIVNRNDYAVQGGGAFGVGYQVLSNSSFDPAEVDFALRMLNYRRQLFGDGVMALDCGANIGVHTVEWAREMYGWGSVVSVEAQERVFYALCGNITINNCFNARAIWGAVGAENGEIMVPRPDYLQPGSYGSLEIRPSARNEFIGQAIDYSEQAGQRTRLFTIDSLALPRLDFLKIDIEGMEMEALAGAMNSIRKYRPQMMIEKIKSDETALRNLLVAEGYRVAALGLNLVAVHTSDPSHVQLLN
jgi:FkbM family methyltransferase